jgi:hypothetical protein
MFCWGEKTRKLSFEEIKERKEEGVLRGKFKILMGRQNGIVEKKER